MQYLRNINGLNRSGENDFACVPSVCSSHPDVVLASLLLARENNQPILIEATSNQVNQFGGYTGMRPSDFIDFVYKICTDHGINKSLVHFGGDHLGPQAWRDKDADTAMALASELVSEYVTAGFSKIHLDCSEGCANEAPQVGDDVSAIRAARLAKVCESVAKNSSDISYVVGTEVPPPGGARADEASGKIIPTKPESARNTILVHKNAFASLGLHDAWDRVVGLVVQPGVEFAPDHVFHFDAMSTDHLSVVLRDYPNLAFEAHSTDYQRPEVFVSLAKRHFTVLKVGPALTFAYRQSIYALDAIRLFMSNRGNEDSLANVMEKLMCDEPKNWQKHYVGDPQEIHLLRHFSYADRIRYYWGLPAAQVATTRVMQELESIHRPLTPILSQYFSEDVIARSLTLERAGYAWPHTLVYAQIQSALAPYFVLMGYSNV